MKKFIALFLAICMAAVLFGCSFTEESGFDYTYNTMLEADAVTVHLYGDEGEEALEVAVTDELTDLFCGEWTKAAGQDGGTKIVTVTVQTQHEITFFDNGIAMIYYGYANVIEKDRSYYNVNLERSVDEICEYANKNGIAIEAANVLSMLRASDDEDSETKEVLVDLFGEGEKTLKMSSSDTDTLRKKLEGSWKTADEKPEGNKMLRITIDGKYKIELYDSSMAMICELNSNGEEKSQSYYDVTLDVEIEELYNYCCENGTVVTE